MGHSEMTYLKRTFVWLEREEPPFCPLLSGSGDERPPLLLVIALCGL